MSSFLMSCEDVLVDLCAMGPARAVVWSLFQQGPLWSVGRAKSCWSQLLLVGWGCHGVAVGGLAVALYPFGCSFAETWSTCAAEHASSRKSYSF